jgi:hypothetical protein
MVSQRRETSSRPAAQDSGGRIGRRRLVLAVVAAAAGLAPAGALAGATENVHLREPAYEVRAGAAAAHTAVRGLAPASPVRPRFLTDARRRTPHRRANLWVHAQQGGSCTRSSRPVAYNAATACSSFGAAYSAANATADGSLVLVRGGRYANVQISGNRTARKRITFAAVPGETVTFTESQFTLGDGTARTAPKYVTITGIVGDEFGANATCPDCRYGFHVRLGSSNIEFRRVTAGSVSIRGAHDILVKDSNLGPCRARTASNSSLTQSLSHCTNNSIDHFGAQPRRITFDNVVIHDYDFSPSCFSLANGGTNTAGQPDCHWEPMFVIGVDGFTLRNSVIRDSFMGVVIAMSGPDAAAVGNKNILIENNVFGTGVNYPGGYAGRAYGRSESVEFSHCHAANPGVYAFENVVYRFNSGSRRAGFQMDLSDGRCARKIRNVRVVGNIGFRNGCTAGVIYRYNLYANGGTCDRTDRSIRAGGSIPFYARDTASPRARDYRLIGRRTVADNRIPNGIGCPAKDRFGRRRGAGGFCDSGAHER